MVGIMQMIPEISISGGMPVIFMPLSLVVFVSAIKDVFEDLKRKKSDNELNNMQTRVLADRGF
jgi:phospholipid-transporting ATPase